MITNMKKKTVKLTFLFLVVAISGCSFYQAHALTISPARIEVSGDPSQTITGEILLINEQEEEKTFYSSVENFEAQGESGTPSFSASKEGLASWVSVQSEVILKKGEQKKVPFSIVIPAGADAGGHFAAIFLSTIPPSVQAGQVSVGAKIGMLILLRVNGEIKEGGGIIDFASENNKKFFVALPVNFSYRLNNEGNDRINPKGEVVIRNTIGLKTDALDANPGQGNILPGSTRKIDLIWGGDEKPLDSGFFTMVMFELTHFAFGRYTAHLNVSYGEHGNAEAKTAIYVLPWQLLTCVLIIGLGGLTFLIIFIKRYNRWIIKRVKESTPNLGSQ